ncbi:MAG: 4-hydroxyphenylacetate 3-hydroxylase N-terminal domain-containing protein [Syntrophales bacterium]|nr:4-hydroxyphenylacetate 3-hydroxylase N-terminal domain-containing protein [Syntrophales bacterium]
MAIRTRKEYLRSLRALRPNIHKFGELIDDVTTHPATRRTVESHARSFDAARDPRYAGIFTTTSSLTGKPVYRFNSLMESLDDIIHNAQLKRTMFRLTGTCTGGLCVGWNTQTILWNITQEIDREFGTDYQKRLKKWIIAAQKRGLVVAGALTDAKGDRGLKPSRQPDPDRHIHVKDVRKDGIVISGTKAMICGVAASDEIFLLPGGGYGEEDKAFALASVVPRDIKGLTIVETRRASDGRELEEGFDIPETGITQAYLIFQDVFIPNERVFLCGEYRYAGKIIEYFTANYRACIGACVAGQGDVMIGTAALMARINGLSANTFKDKIVDMAVNNETTYGLGIGAMALGRRHEAGGWIADALLAHTNKVRVATLPYETKRLCQDIGGGIVETGCFPSCKDFHDPVYGHLVQRAIKAGTRFSAEARARAARLGEWLTIGAGVPGCMHGGGSPDGARLVVKSRTPVNEYAEYARRIAGIIEDIPEPEPQKKKEQGK